MKHLTAILSALLCLSLLTACGNTSRVPTLDELNASTSKATTTTAATAATAATLPADPNDTDYDVSDFTLSSYLDVDGHFEGVEALDCVTLPDYAAVSIPAEVHTISDEAVDEQIELIRENAMTYEQITDRAIVDGDTVNIDYVGTVDGVAFDGGSTGGAGTNVTIGVTQYIDDFLEQLIGHTPGETVEVEVTFPEDYGVEELNGRDAVFTTVINYIQGDELYPDINDEYVATVFGEAFGWTTLEQLREALRDDLRKAAVSSYLETWLVENTDYASVPDALYDYQACTLIYNCTSTAASYGVDLSMYLAYVVGVPTVSELLDAQDAALTHYSHYYLATQAIAEQEGIAMTDELLSTYFAENYGSADYSAFAERYGEPYLRFVAINDTVLNLMMDGAVLA